MYVQDAQWSRAATTILLKLSAVGTQSVVVKVVLAVALRASGNAVGTHIQLVCHRVRSEERR